MSVSLTYEEDSSNMDEMLHYAQLISEAFTKALDQNECNVKLLIGFAEEIDRGKDELVDIVDIIDDPDKAITPPVVEDTLNPDIDNIITPTNPEPYTPITTQDIVRNLRQSCLDCDFGFPSIDLNGNLNFAFDKLRAMLNLYNDLFKKMLNPNLCHVANAFQYSCIPSIISLIMLLVSAYTAILAIKKLGGISLDAFIKGVISGLLGQIISSLGLRVDTSRTGVSCLIEAIREIAENINQQGSYVTGVVPTEVLTQLGYKPDDRSDLDKAVDAEVQTVTGTAPTEFSQSQYLDIYANMTFDERSIVNKYLSKVESENNKINNAVSTAFYEVNDILTEMIKNMNENMSQMFGLLDYFQCESERSGSGFTDVMEYINRLTTVINLLSAILAIVAKKQVKKLCKTKQSVNEMITTLTETPVGEPLTDLEEVELIGEFLEKVVEITKDENNEIVPIIYEKDKEPLLPKLKITSCNLREFIDEHNIDNVVDKVIKEITEEEKRERDLEIPTIGKPDLSRIVTPDKEFIIDKNKWTEYPIKFVKPKYTKTRATDVTKDIITEDIDSDVGFNTGIQNLLDLIYNNPLDNNTSTKDPETNNKVTPPTDDDEAIVNKDYRTFIKAPLNVNKAEKKAFENRCKSIEDVLAQLGDINKT
jgi:hypothetical protein